MALIILQEHEHIKKLAPLSKYSTTLAEALIPHIKGARDLTQYRPIPLLKSRELLHIDVGFNLFVHDWATNGNTMGGMIPGTHDADIQRLIQLETAANLINTQESEIHGILRSFMTDNRCLILHISAALDINPLQLEVSLVKEAVSLLTRPGTHLSRATILTSILDYNGDPNANIFILVFPDIIRHATIRVIMVETNMAIQKVLEYKRSRDFNQENQEKHQGFFFLTESFLFQEKAT
jgi:hypothetical protein